MTAQTPAYLKANEFTLTGVPGRIIPQNMVDVCDSYQPWDAASGVALPYISKGTLDGANYFVSQGGVIGSGQTTGQRQTNATALTAVFTQAIAQNKFIDLAPGVYEINSSTGIVIPPCNGLVFRGSMYGTQIVQYYASGSGAPILTLGDVTGTTSSNGWDFHGVNCTYGAAQTGLTLSQSVIVGAHTFSKIGSLNLFNASNPSYDGFVWNGGGLGNFSCIYDNILIWMVQRDFLRNESGGTGNIIDNVYCNNGGSGTANPITGNYLNMASSTNDWHFRRANFEWGGTNKVMSLNNTIGCHFDALHIEGITLTGSNPDVMATTDSSIKIDVFDLIDLTATVAGGQALLQDYVGGASVVEIGTFTWVNNHTNQVTNPFQFYTPAASGIDDTLIFTIDGGYLRDATSGGNLVFQSGTSVFFDSNMPVANFITPNKFGRYSYGVGGSSVQYAQIPVSATYTHYSQHNWATLQVPASVTGFTITLAAKVGAIGTRAAPTGNVVRMRRLSGSVSGTVLVKDDAGTTLVTSTTAGADYFFIFNGTHYVTFTPEAG